MEQFELTQQDVPEDIAWLCEIVGIRSFMEIIDMAGGEYLYLPKRQTLEQPLRHAAICREFNGCNYKQLARKYGMSERQVRMIVKKAFAAQDGAPDAKTSPHGAQASSNAARRGV